MASLRWSWEGLFAGAALVDVCGKSIYYENTLEELHIIIRPLEVEVPTTTTICRLLLIPNNGDKRNYTCLPLLCVIILPARRSSLPLLPECSPRSTPALAPLSASQELH